MKKSRLTVIIAILTILVFSFETVMVSAASLSEIKNDIKDKKNELYDSKKKLNSLGDQVSALERQINSKENDIARLEDAIAEAQKNLEALEADLKKAEEKVKTQNANLDSRLRSMYKNGTVGFIDVLLDSGSFSEFLTNLDMVERVYSSDKKMLDQLQKSYDEIETKRNEVEAAKVELDESRSFAQEEKAGLEADKAEVVKKKSAIAADVEATERELDKLEAEAEALSSTIKNEGSSSTNSQYNGGAMAWPAPAFTRISSKYGYRKHPITGKLKKHSGVDLAAPGGSPILAANSGKVIRATYSSGYGNHVVIDHGGGVTTLYAHSSKLLVRKGQQVSRGQQIAKVGTTGSSTGNHLHFEVRINGSTVNPMPYIT